MCEIWMEDAKRQAAWDQRISRRPRCLDCKKYIAGEKCLPIGDGYVCTRCVEWRMVEVDEIEL